MTTTGRATTLEKQIDQWRSFLRRRQAIQAVDVALGAISARITELGFSPSRVAALETDQRFTLHCPPSRTNGIATVVEVDSTTPGCFETDSTLTTLSVARLSFSTTRTPPEATPAASAAFFGTIFR